jgi:predicted membrane protein
VKVLVEDCNAYKNYAFQCETSFSAVSSDAVAASSTMMISGAALLGVAALVLFAARKRRNATINLDQEDQPGFEMMNDSAVRA